jgi:succinate-acetate transporter protein
MPTGPTDARASLYGSVSLVLGSAAALAAALIGWVGVALPLLFGSLAVTFAVLGLVHKINRRKCAIGLISGAVGVLYPVFLICAAGVG